MPGLLPVMQQYKHFFIALVSMKVQMMHRKGIYAGESVPKEVLRMVSIEAKRKFVDSITFVFAVDHAGSGTRANGGLNETSKWAEKHNKAANKTRWTAHPDKRCKRAKHRDMQKCQSQDVKQKAN